MSFDSLLNRTCTIEVATKAQDADSGQFIDTFATQTSSVKCRLDPAGGGIVKLPEQIFERTTHLLFMRNQTTNPTVENHRIDVSGTKYNILRVDRFDASVDSHHLQLALERIVN